MSILNLLKNSVDFLNELYFLHRNNFKFLEFVKSLYQFSLPFFKDIFIYLIQFKWIYDFIHIPVSTSSNKIQNFSEYFYFNIELNNQIIPTDSFFSGLLKSVPIYITFSSIQLLTILRLLIEGHLSAIAAAIGTTFGYIIFIILTYWSGLRQLVIIWYSVEPLSYMFGVSLFFIIVFSLMHKPINKFRFWNKKELFKIGLISCLLVFTEQTSLFYYFDNISLQPNISFLDNFEIENLILYILGFTVGSIILSTFAGFIAIAIEKFIVQYLSVSYVKYVKKINFLFITFFVALNITSLPYYGIDYLALSPIGFVSQDEAIAKFIANTSFPDFQQGRLGESSAFTSVDTDLTPFDRTRYLTGHETEFTFEDFNYESEYAWKTRVDRLSSTTYSGRPVNKFLRKFLPNRVLIKQDFPEVTKLELERKKIDNNVFNLLSAFKGLTERFFEDYNDEVLDLSYPVFEVENDKMLEFNHEYDESELADKRQYEQLQLHKLELLKQAKINREKRKLELLKNELSKPNLDKNEKNFNYSSQYVTPKIEMDIADFSNEYFSAFSELLKYGFDSFSIFQEFETDPFDEHLSRKIKKKYYLNKIYRNILNSHILDFFNRGSKNQKLTDKDEKNLVFNRFILNKYYDTLRDYMKTQYSLAFTELFKGPKTYLNRIYNHQFNGTFKIVRRLFLLNIEKTQSFDLNNYDKKYLEYYISTQLLPRLKNQRKIFFSPLKLKKLHILKKTIKRSKKIRSIRKQLKAKRVSKIPTGIPGVMKTLPILKLSFSPQQELLRKQQKKEQKLLFRKRYRLYNILKKQLKLKFIQKIINRNFKHLKYKFRIPNFKLLNLSTNQFNYLSTLSSDAQLTANVNYYLNFKTKTKHNLFNDYVFLYKDFLTYLKSKNLILNIFRTDKYKKLILFKQNQTLIEPTELDEFQTEQMDPPQIINVEKFHNLNLYCKQNDCINLDDSNNNNNNKKGNKNYDNAGFNDVRYDATNYIDIKQYANRHDQISNYDNGIKELIKNFEISNKIVDSFINQFQINDTLLYKYKNMYSNFQRSDYLNSLQYIYILNKLKNHFEVYLDKNVEQLISNSIRKYVFYKIIKYNKKINRAKLKIFLKNHLIIFNFRKYRKKLNLNRLKVNINFRLLSKLDLDKKVKISEIDSFIQTYINDIERFIDLENVDDINLNAYQFEQPLIESEKEKIEYNEKNIQSLTETYNTILKFDQALYKKKSYEPNYLLHEELIEDYFDFNNPYIENFNYKLNSNFDTIQNNHISNNLENDLESAQTSSSEDETYDDETSEDETYDDETSEDETYDDETSEDETYDDETSEDETYDDETSEDETYDDETSEDETYDDEASTDEAHLDSYAKEASTDSSDSSDYDQPATDQPATDQPATDQKPNLPEPDFEIEPLSLEKRIEYRLEIKNNFNSPFLQEEAINPFFAGWDFKNRKFIVTSCFLPEKKILRKINKLKIFSDSNENENKLKFTLWPLSYDKDPKIRMSRYYSEPEMQHQIDLFDIIIPKNEEQQEEAQMLYQALPNLIDRIDLQNQDKQLRKLNPKVGGLNWLGKEELKVDFEYLFKRWNKKIKSFYKNYINIEADGT
uniref:Ycf1 n=1 Tax=Avrainvillea mazei TaxID=381412 RepID=A0A1X9RPQ9_9CHLO|nr:hypothetical protein [Avrainvillea mazei]